MEYLQRTACANTPNDAGESAPEEDSVEDANAKETGNTSPEMLLSVFEQLMAAVRGPFVDREAAALHLANELVRRWCEAELTRLGERYGDEVRVDGDTYRRHARGTRRYHTLCGAIEVPRDIYRLVGVHNGPTVVPLELEAGIVENATPALAFSVVQGFAERPLRHYEAEMAAAHRSVPSRSTLERIGKRIGVRVREALPLVEPIVRASEVVPAEAYSMSIGLDRTTVPMAEHVEAARRCRQRPYVRRPPEPIAVAYRMAYVATIAIHDREGTTLVSKRLGSTADEGPRALLDRLGAEVRYVLSQRDLVLTIVQDGAPELWNLVDEWLEREGLTAGAKLIDRFHVDERLAQICEAITYTTDDARDLYRRWREQLNRSDTAIDRICRHLNELADHQVLGQVDGDPMPAYWANVARPTITGERAQIAWGHLGYLDRHRKYLRYASCRRRGLAIGSGVTEGACKSVITMRFKRSGQRWFEQGLSPCLQLRALHLNERLRPCFDLLVAARTASLAAA